MAGGSGGGWFRQRGCTLQLRFASQWLEDPVAVGSGRRTRVVIPCRYHASMTPPPIRSWFDVAPAVVAIRRAAYFEARYKLLSIPEFVELELRRIRELAERLRTAGHADWADKVLRLHGGTRHDALCRVIGDGRE